MEEAAGLAAVQVLGFPQLHLLLERAFLGKDLLEDFRKIKELTTVVGLEQVAAAVLEKQVKLAPMMLVKEGMVETALLIRLLEHL
jgi:hypothetical protein